MLAAPKGCEQYRARQVCARTDFSDLKYQGFLTGGAGKAGAAAF